MKKILLLLTAFLVVLVSCKKNDPPPLPPKESMVMDFAQFSTNSLKSVANPDSVSNTYFQHAKNTIGFWNFFMTVTLFVPVTSYLESFKHEAKALDKNSWQWKYDYKALFATYSARLVGTRLESDIKWEMYISKTGIEPFAEVKWYEGLMKKDGSSGSWTLNERLTTGTMMPLLQVDWTKGSDGKVNNLKYTYVKENTLEGNPDPFNSSYIEFGNRPAESLNKYYSIYIWDVFSLDFMNVDIEWNSTSYNGRIKAPIAPSNNEWKYWDAEGNNVEE